MKKIIMTMAIMFLLVGCSGNSKKESDTRTLDDIVAAFEAEYEIRDLDKPSYEMINAEDGAIFYVDNSVVKIYKYADNDALDQAIENSIMLSSMERNGVFLAESSDDQYVEFFKTIK